jgi:hypothetical protein
VSAQNGAEPVTITDKRGAPTTPVKSSKKGGASVETRVKTLEAKVDAQTWYIAELQLVLKAFVEQFAIQQSLPQLEAQARAQIREQLKGGFTNLGGVTAQL